jgi:hypothetical protein
MYQESLLYREERLEASKKLISGKAKRQPE